MRKFVLITALSGVLLLCACGENPQESISSSEPDFTVTTSVSETETVTVTDIPEITEIQTKTEISSDTATVSQTITTVLQTETTTAVSDSGNIP